MKKGIFIISLCIIAGLFLGTYTFNKLENKDTKKVSANVLTNQNVYAFQYGVYSNKDNLKSLEGINYTYEYLNDKYYVYVGMTKNEKNIEKLKKYFESINYPIYVKEIEVNGEFAETLKQYDLLLDEAVQNESIKTILESVIAKYEELAINDENKRITT